MVHFSRDEEMNGAIPIIGTEPVAAVSHLRHGRPRRTVLGRGAGTFVGVCVGGMKLRDMFFDYIKIMSLEATRSYLIEWLYHLQDQKLLGELKQIAASHAEGDWWENIGDAARKHIEKGNQDYLQGRMHTNGDVLQEFDEKFGL